MTSVLLAVIFGLYSCLVAFRFNFTSFFDNVIMGVL